MDEPFVLPGESAEQEGGVMPLLTGESMFHGTTKVVDGWIGDRSALFKTGVFSFRPREMSAYRGSPPIAPMSLMFMVIARQPISIGFIFSGK